MVIQYQIEYINLFNNAVDWLEIYSLLLSRHGSDKLDHMSHSLLSISFAVKGTVENLRWCLYQVCDAACLYHDSLR